MKNARWRLLDRAFLGAMATGALIELSNTGAGLIDGALTARLLGSNAMAAIGIGAPIFTLMGLFGGLLAMGMQSICSEEIGRGNYKRFGEISSLAIVAGLAISLLLMFVCYTFTDTIAALFGARGDAAELLEPAVQYIRGLCVCMPVGVELFIFSPAIQLDNGGNRAMVASLIGAAFDVILDFAAIKLNMGVFGVGLATSVAKIIEFSVLMLHFRKKDRMLRISLKFTTPIRALLQMCKKGMTVAVRRFANILRPMIVNNYIVLLGGTAAVTALSIKQSIAEVALVFSTGISSAVALMMGVAYGERNSNDMMRIGRVTHIVAILSNAAVAVFCLIFAPMIADFYVGGKPEIRDMVKFALYLLGAEAFADTLLVCRVSYLNVVSATREAWLLQFSHRLLSIVPSVLVMGYFFKSYGVLSSNTVAYVALLFVVYIVNAIRVKHAKVTKTEYLRLDESFLKAPGDVVDLDIRNIGDATLVSEQVQMFIKGHRLGTKKAYHAALAVEECARLLFEQNDFSPKMSMDIRVVIDGEDAIIRIRDNGKSVYPLGGVGGEDGQEDTFSNIGIKILQKTAKDIKHYHSMKVNYTMITV